MPMPIMQGPGRPPIMVGGPMPRQSRQYRGRSGQLGASSVRLASAAGWGLGVLALVIAFELFGARLLAYMVGPMLFGRLTTLVPLVMALLAGFIVTVQTRKLRACLLTGAVIGIGVAACISGMAAVSHNLAQAALETAGVGALAIIVAAFIGGLMAAVVNLARRNAA